MFFCFVKNTTKKPLDTFSLHNGSCAKQEQIQCCSSVPEHWIEIPEDEDVEDWSVLLCEPIIKENEAGSSDVLEIDGDCRYEWIGGSHTNGCWWSKYCCMDDLWWDGLAQITCDNLSENFCDDSIVWTPKTGKKYDKFTCEEWYHLEWCDCVSDSPETINITCSTTYDYDIPTNGCYQTMWVATTYTADKALPTNVRIGQNKYGYGISARNGCTNCYHPVTKYVANYTISAWQTQSTSKGSERDSTINHYDGDLWWDMAMMNGKSSFLSDITNKIEITNISTGMEYTDSSGKKYTINLYDCEDVHDAWLSAWNGFLNDPNWTNCSDPSNPILTSCSCDWDWGCLAGTNGRLCVRESKSDGTYICKEQQSDGTRTETTTCRDESGWWSTQWQNIVLYNNTQRVIKLYNNATYPFHFNDTSYKEDDDGCVGTSQACDLYLGPWWWDFGIEYEYCNQNQTFAAQSCREIDLMCGALYSVNIDCSTNTIHFDQNSATIN